MRKKIFTFLLALVTSVGMMNAAVDGKLSGAFTVDGSGTQVYFSQGNLQYVGGNWQFAENQWDVIGSSQTNSSRDLFGWGTGNNPNQTSDEYEDYTTFADWGSNMGGDWRTLTRDEWLYIFNTRTSASDLRGSATVCGVHGYIILPDNFVLPGGLSWTPRPNDWTTNVYTSQEWSSMEENGAVFLPAAGYRAGTTVYYDGSAWGYYWSATEHPQAYYAYSAWVADEDSYVRVYQRDRTYGHSVRLVSETTPGGGSTPNPHGECGAQGDNLLWELNTSTGVLTITGSGAMYDWTSDTDRPWYSLRAQITSVVLPSGITSLGKYAFRGTDIVSINMTENYPAGLTTINQEAFFSTQLTSVTIPESVVTIGMDAFRESKTITDVYCYADPNNLTWNDYWCDDFKNADHATVCHVKACALSTYEANWGGTPYNVYNSTGVNVTFVGDLPGDCGAPTPTPSGDKLPGVFSISSTETVNFSKGNLQYVGGNWQFADNQWDVIGASQADNNRDLFGWGTGNNPNQTSMQYGDYSTFADWGSNMGGDWRTLTRDEWLYIFDTRTSASALRGSATVCGVHGYIILPDNFVLPDGLSWTPRPDDWTTNVYTSQEWSSMEENGAVFLPVTGYRAGTTVIYDESSWGYYWSATEHSQAYNAYNVWVADEDDNVKVFYRSRTFGQSVRLVSETAPTPTPTDEQVPTNVDPDNSSYHYSTFFHSSQNYKLSNDGTQAFIADLSNNELVLTEIAHGEQVIPANTAVILRKTGSADPVVLVPTAENGVSVNPDDNSLRGVDDATTLESLSINPLQCYVLSGKSHDETESGVGFYRIYGTTLKAHKAYVIFAGSSNNAPKKMRFVYGQATGIEDVQGNNVQSTKVIENGVLYIIRDGKTYNAMGQMVK